MFKCVRYGLLVLGLSLTVVAQAASLCAGSGVNGICHFTFTAIPTFANFDLGVPQSGIYTIKNNTPVSLKMMYIRIQDNDSFPAAATAIVSAPTNSCVVGTSLASGATCNIQVNLIPLSIGTFDRVLQIGINSRQVELDAPAIIATVNTPPAPPAPPTPTPPAPTPPDPTLYRASILGASTVTNTGLSTINGDVDLSPGSAITGFPPGVIVNGATHISDTTANNAQTDALAYYNSAVGLPCGTVLTGQDLGGKTLTPGVYCFSSSAGLGVIGTNSTLTLDGGGDPNSAFVFQIGSTLTTASNAHVVLQNGANNGNVTWAVGTSATIGTGSAFQGIIVAYSGSITLTTGASLLGRAWSLNGAVTLDTNAVNPN